MMLHFFKKNEWLDMKYVIIHVPFKDVDIPSRIIILQSVRDMLQRCYLLRYNYEIRMVFPLDVQKYNVQKS